MTRGRQVKHLAKKDVGELAGGEWQEQLHGVRVNVNCCQARINKMTAISKRESPAPPSLFPHQARSETPPPNIMQVC